MKTILLVCLISFSAHAADPTSLLRAEDACYDHLDDMAKTDPQTGKTYPNFLAAILAPEPGLPPDSPWKPGIAWLPQQYDDAGTAHPFYAKFCPRIAHDAFQEFLKENAAQEEARKAAILHYLGIH